MRFAILSLVAAGALAISAGTADAAPPYNHGGYSHGYYGGYRGGYNNFYRPYYGGYNSGFGLTVGGSRGFLSFGNVYPSYGYGSFYRPYYGGYGYGYGYPRYGSPWRW